MTTFAAAGSKTTHQRRRALADGVGSGASDLGDLLLTLIGHKIRLGADAGMLTFSPRSALTDSDLTAMRRHKPHLLKLLDEAQTHPLSRAACISLSSDERAHLATEASTGNHLAALALVMLIVIAMPVAWLLYSRRLDRELWLLSEPAAGEFIAPDDLRPVVLAEELEALRGLSTEALGRALDTKSVFPGARVVAEVPTP